MREGRGVYRVLVGKPEERIILGWIFGKWMCGLDGAGSV
jgi:hypothetical protein